VAIIGGPGSSNGPGSSDGAAAAPIVPGSPSGGSEAPLLFLLAASIVAAGYLWFLARRRRRRPEPALAPVTTSPFAGPSRPMPAAPIVPPKPDKVKRTRAPKANPAVPTSAAASPAAPSAALFELSPTEAAPLLRAPLEPYGEALMPRWRRPSLRMARYASPKVAPEPAPALTFAAGASAGLERRLVRYDLVALIDVPDEIKGAQVGQLQANDEVEITGRQGAWVKVRTPLGAEGWIHRTTLQATDRASEAVKPAPATEAAAGPVPAVAPDSIEAEVAMGAFAAATAAHERVLEAARVTAVVSEPQVDSKPAKRPRTRRPVTPKSAPNT
jgi:membrane protein implicated in regulation of membrane protease activity